MYENKLKTGFFEEALKFFNEYQWLYNEPVTKLLTAGCLQSFPIDWIDCLHRLNNEELNHYISSFKYQDHWSESLKLFIRRCQEFDLLKNVSSLKSTLGLPKVFSKYLSLKKQHEIIRLAELVHEECKTRHLEYIIDIGSGLGYISQLLYFLFGYKVLGFESKSKNVETAERRQRELFPESINFVKYVCLTISHDSHEKIKTLLLENYTDFNQVCLLGLHCCGDLSIHITKIFIELQQAQLLIVLPCCYHKYELKEELLSLEGQESFKYFPVSKALVKAANSCNLDFTYLIRRTFLRLASQETNDRWKNKEDKSHLYHSFHVLARAVLEKYASTRECLLRKKSQKAPKSEFCNFESYLEDCGRKYELIERVRGETIIWDQTMRNDLIELWKKNMKYQHKVELYTGLQLLLQKSAESLVLMDRVAYLMEHKYSVNIICVTNRSLSPRSYAIVSCK